MKTFKQIKIGETFYRMFTSGRWIAYEKTSNSDNKNNCKIVGTYNNDRNCIGNEDCIFNSTIVQ